jgi:PAS domain S-box-containing protein
VWAVPSSRPARRPKNGSPRPGSARPAGSRAAGGPGALRDLLEQAPDAIAVHRQGRFLYVNPALVAALGYAHASDLVGSDLLALVHPDDRAMAVERLRRIYETGKPNPMVEHRLFRRDGSIIVAELAGVPVEWLDGPAVVTFSRDITQRKRVEAQLVLADRLAALGTLCAGVAHEINNPLGYVIANLDVVGRELPTLVEALRAIEPRGEGVVASTAAQRLEHLGKLVAMTREGTEQVRRIVADLRSLSRDDAGERGPVDVRWALEGALNLARYEIARRARLVRSLEDVALVEANAPRLEQVFLNLLMNAAQAIPAGDPERHEIRVRTGTADGHVLVEIADSGTGFPQELAGRIFDPFFTTKPPGEGVGLGLSICHGIVTGLGGLIEASSGIGGGATFRVLLPPMRSAGTGGAAEP